MTAPSPEQIAEWRSDYRIGYDDAKTEQATEIAALKAQIAELMPLAKFGAMVLRTYSHNGDITEAQVNNAAKQTNCMGDAKAWTVFMPNIEATITKILKD
jgi:hypothetical protein